MTSKILLSLIIFAAAILFAVSCQRDGRQAANGNTQGGQSAGPTAATDQGQPQTSTTSELGTTATYKGILFRVYPSEQVPGGMVTISWTVPDTIKSVKIEGQDAPLVGSLNVATPPESDEKVQSYTYHLEAKPKDGGQPIKLEVSVKLKPRT